MGGTADYKRSSLFTIFIIVNRDERFFVYYKSATNSTNDFYLINRKKS